MKGSSEYGLHRRIGTYALLTALGLILILLKIVPLGVPGVWLWSDWWLGWTFGERLAAASRSFHWNTLVALTYVFVVGACGLVSWGCLRREKTAAVPFIAFFLYLFSYTFLWLLRPEGLEQIGHNMLHIIRSGYFYTSLQIESAGQFLSSYPSLARDLPSHVPSHPPFSTILFYLLDRVNVGVCGDRLSLLGRATLVGIQLQSLAALTVFPLYLLGRSVYSRGVGAASALILAVTPSVVHISAPGLDQVHMLPVVTSFYLLHLGLSRQRRSLISAASLVMTVALLIGFGMLILLPAFCGWILIHHLYCRRRSLTGIGGDVGALILPVIVVFLAIFAVWRLNMLEVYSTCSRMIVVMGSENFARPYFLSLLGNPYEFFLYVGIPISTQFFLKLGVSARGSCLSPRNSAAWRLCLCFLLFFLALNFSGFLRGEVARIWIFMVPFLILVCVSELTRFSNEGFSLAVLSLMVLQAIQVLLFKCSMYPLVNYRDSFFIEKLRRLMIQ